MRIVRRPAAWLATAVLVLGACSPAGTGENQPTAEPSSTSNGTPAPSVPAATNTQELPSPLGSAPTVKVDGNKFVDGSGNEIRLLGVNFAGVEGTCVDAGFDTGATDQQPGPVFDYQGSDSVVVAGQPPALPESFFATLQAWHVNAVRFMVNEMCWLGRPPNSANNPPVAPIPQAHYDSAAYRKALTDFVSELHRHGIISVAVLGDNPKPYDDNGTQLNPPGSEFAPPDDNQQVMPDENNSPDFWASFAATFKDDHSMVFELFNEPHINTVIGDPQADWACWLNGCDVPNHGWQAAGVQQLIGSIRDAGATQPILVPGIWYSSQIYRPEYGGGPAVGWIVAGTTPQDSLNPPQLAAANHMYNTTYDNTDQGCSAGVGPECWENVIGIVAEQVPVVTSELGEFDCDTTADFVDKYMTWADSATSTRDKISYLLWTFNADYGCYYGNATLVSDWSGTPNLEGQALQAHLAKEGGK